MATGPARLRIMTCNIRHNVKQDAETGDNWEARRDFCAQLMLSHNPDVLCIQECANLHYLDLCARLPQYASYGLSTINVLYSPSNVIFYRRSRFEFIFGGGFWLSETPHIEGTKSWDCANARFTNYVQLRDYDSRKRFRVWNTHFDHIGRTAREKQAEMMVEASRVLPEDMPQFATADYNADIKHPAIIAMKAGGWVDTYEDVHGPNDPGFTYHGFRGPSYIEFRPNTMGKIDFIFRRGPVTALESQVIKDSRNGHYPSDHYFVVADVSI
ncbi:MAG: endonuclease/exonuclease/phosphatase family protein [Armatimonadetes bacterium]|nr:endonuclease/exonuclease/phosphatase family protein [Armatimonadota bacterium]